jgi:hypothetical protein
MLSIEKLEYRRCYFDLSTMKNGARITTVITNDGTIISRKYKAGSRKVDSVQKTSCSLVEFEKLCNEIELCIETADRLDFYVDDASEELRIFYNYGRVQIMDRGLGNYNTHIGKIVNGFLEKNLK